MLKLKGTVMLPASLSQLNGQLPELDPQAINSSQNVVTNSLKLVSLPLRMIL
jgi:hypothetical protein